MMKRPRLMLALSLLVVGLIGLAFVLEGWRIHALHFSANAPQPLSSNSTTKPVSTIELLEQLRDAEFSTRIQAAEHISNDRRLQGLSETALHDLLGTPDFAGRFGAGVQSYSLGTNRIDDWFLHIELTDGHVSDVRIGWD